MRKLLLGTTALAAAATLSANAALADVSISGYYEWVYNSRSSNITTLDGTTMSGDSEITFKFSNKTDSGLDIVMTTELQSDENETTPIDETSLSIAGGFGKFVLGGNDSVGDNYGIEAEDLIAEEAAPVGTNATVSTDTDIAASHDSSKISYHLPAMGGFTAGVSHYTTVDGSADKTEYGAQFTTSASGASITLGGATGTTDAATKDTDSQNIGVKIVSGAVSFIAAQGSYEAVDEDREANGAAIKYDMGNGMTIAVSTMESDDSLDAGEEYTNTGVEVTYAIASGLTAYLTINDYDYKPGTEATGTADSGTNSKLTIKATF